VLSARTTAATPARKVHVGPSSNGRKSGVCVDAHAGRIDYRDAINSFTQGASGKEYK
jgi:hypothetical protein